MFELTDKSKENIKDATGINVDEIPNIGVGEIDRRIEKNIGKKLKPNLYARFFIGIRENTADKILNKRLKKK